MERQRLLFSIPIERFTYVETGMRDRWLNLLEQIHFLGVSVRRCIDENWIWVDGFICRVQYRFEIDNDEQKRSSVNFIFVPNEHVFKSLENIRIFQD